MTTHSAPTTELAKSFEPAAIEARWAPLWEARGYFTAGTDPARPSFSIQLPPPNVTGLLHMGHGFNHTIMDALSRYHRMSGFNTLWLPGTDHAGIATQIVVERQLQSQGVDRREDRARCVRREGMGVEGILGRHDPAADAATRRLGRLEPDLFHDGRETVRRGGRDLRAVVRAGLDLPRQAPGQLGPEAADGRVGSRGRNRGGRRSPVGDPLSRRGQR
jgi:hypothetical protein